MRMGKLILTMHTSADGFVATGDGKMWPTFGWPAEAQSLVNELYADVEAAIYGRGIYQTVIPFWTDVAINGVPHGAPLGEFDLDFARLLLPVRKYVVSRTYEPQEPDTTAIRANIATEVERIKAGTSGAVVLLAGGAITAELLKAKLIDEILLLTGPVLLGSGRPLADLSEPIPLSLLSVDTFAPKCVVSRYRIEADFPTQR
ncbi:conserved hypothetical protein [Renibacterium salmoninarum ATCC 33209]|uniref:Bacterial bifunctional deaminase-reductase C-terminal domain-containing protein n=2 Tax=Renibacterium salmoninarum TaxID=1646 RepID=A9WP59_RENSM|nr:conserved hypothetical protein [Renibacterium salmoninarum ATCC 33209]